VADRDRADAARSADEDAAIVDYCKALQAELGCRRSASRCARCSIVKPAKAATKRWGWVKKGAPIVIEVGGAISRRQCLGDPPR
jgi:prolyl-tRNA synthetase